MIRDMRVYLQDIWESILAAEEYTRGLTREEFLNNRQVQDVGKSGVLRTPIPEALVQ